ncbi:MAG TPA: HAD hydrolase family protein [Candidatus Omnitrophota bacterium]|nr:HAD hydrolase family protein [Candidatus Omnitrophota bacterium]
MNKKIAEKIKKIKLLILDVDGILTNGEIILDEKGREIKIFDVQDGFGIVLFQRAGFKTAILSAKSAPAVTARAKDLKIGKVCQNASPKIVAYKKILRHFKLTDAQACFMADDLTDMEVLRKVGLSVTVPNAVNEVKRIADYMTKREGGRGAVREVVELILKAQNKWAGILKAYVA